MKLDEWEELFRDPEFARDYIDWVELGCRGWKIDNDGAEMIHDWQEGPGFKCCPDDYAYLDLSLRLVIAGCPDFVGRVMRDMMAVGLIDYPVVTYAIGTTSGFRTPAETVASAGYSTEVVK